jgi:HSP20 family protein
MGDEVEKKTEKLSVQKSKENYHPFEWMTNLDEWFDNFRRNFDLFYRPFRFPELPSLRIPAMDIYEDRDKYEITAEVPGLNKNDIDINLINNSIEIKAERKEEREIKKENYIRKERGRKKYYRKIPLPKNIDKKEIDASFANGIITLVIPKVEISKEEPTKIKIN